MVYRPYIYTNLMYNNFLFSRDANECSWSHHHKLIYVLNNTSDNTTN